MNKKKLFFTVGSTYPLDRLIKQADELNTNKKYEVFAQIGESTFAPKNIKWTKFMDYEEMVKKIEWANIIVSHAGAGTIIECISKNKKLILFPRLKKYGEAVDDHQLEICKAFKEKYEINYFTGNDLKSVLEKKVGHINRKNSSLAKEIAKLL
ncbi:MAG: glycosyltransferase [archaeon]